MRLSPTLPLAAGVACVLVPFAVLAGFSDVPRTHPHANAITWVESTRIVSGYPDGTFHPDSPINRAELTKIFVGSVTVKPVAGCSLGAGLSSLSDVQSSAWFFDFVCEARNRGIIDGYPDRTFKPGRYVNSAEAAKIAVKAFGFVVGVDPKVWYRPYMEELKTRDILPETAYDPNHLLTRGEMAEMIYRLKNPGVGDDTLKKCIVGGCSGQLCVEEGSQDVSTCEWRDEYACYKTANCGRLSDGNCGWQQTLELTECLKNPTGAQSSNGTYGPYSQSAIGNGKTAVLFFYAAWCPYCREDDALLTQWYASLGFPISTYRVNYDTEKTLKQTYGVVQQHTFVLIDGAGNKIRSLTGPSESELKAMLAGT